MKYMKCIFSIALMFCYMAAYGQDVKIEGPKRNSNVQSKTAVKKTTTVSNQSTSVTKGFVHQGQSVSLPNNIPSYSKAADFYPLAMQGDAESMCKLGKSFLNGENGVQKNHDEAFYWLMKASDLEHPNAMAWLADCYYEGWGCAKNYNQVFYLSKKSAERGDSYGWHQLGFCYFYGVGTSSNIELAIPWLIKSAEAGLCEDQLVLAIIYDRAKDETNAFFWTKKAAEQGNAVAQNQLGEYYIAGKGCTKNYVTGFTWITKAANNGDANAMYNIALCYYNGIGTSVNKNDAANWAKKAADKGVKGAQELYKKADSERYGKEPQLIQLP